MGISIRQYAKSRHVTYEAVRRQVVRYDKELKDHIERTGTGIYLDDEACTFLDEHRQKRTIIVNDESKSEVEALNLEIEQLKAERNKLKDTIMSLQNELKDTIKQNTDLLADKARTDTILLIADKEHDELEKTKQVLTDTKLDLEVSRNTCTTMQQQLEESKQELNKYHKSIFGFYRKDV